MGWGGEAWNGQLGSHGMGLPFFPPHRTRTVKSHCSLCPSKPLSTSLHGNEGGGHLLPVPDAGLDSSSRSALTGSVTLRSHLTSSRLHLHL